MRIRGNTVLVLGTKFGGNPSLTVIKPEMWSKISSTNLLQK